MIYDFRCLSSGCRKRFSADLPMKGSRKKARCPKCGSKKVKKIIHKPNFILKGSGFYSTDNKK